MQFTIETWQQCLLSFHTLIAIAINSFLVKIFAVCGFFFYGMDVPQLLYLTISVWFNNIITMYLAKESHVPLLLTIWKNQLTILVLSRVSLILACFVPGGRLNSFRAISLTNESKTPLIRESPTKAMFPFPLFLS